jgi:hypothetical protein
MDLLIILSIILSLCEDLENALHVYCVDALISFEQSISYFVGMILKHPYHGPRLYKWIMTLINMFKGHYPRVGPKNYCLGHKNYSLGP